MKEQVFIDYLFQMMGICGAVYDLGSESFICMTKDQEKLFNYIFEQEKQGEKEISYEKEFPYLASLGENIYYWSFVADDRWYAFGPVGTVFLRYDEMRSLAHKLHMDYGLLEIPKISPDRYHALMSFTVWQMTGKQLDEDVVIKGQSVYVSNPEKEKMEYDIYRIQKESIHTPYEYEESLMRAIEEGLSEDISSISQMQLKKYPGQDLGLLAVNSEFKQQEYMNVSFIALSTRAAIRGGVPPRTAYETSDLFLQRMSRCSSIMELMDIANEVAEKFASLVREYRQTNQGVLIEQCKDYIAKHLYKKFTISQMAEDMAVSRTYLSGKFSEKTGMTIQQYIIDQRLNAAANLLKYSTESIAQISDYMNFSSQGRFSGYFKKKYGMTPLQYREKYKLIEFK